LSKHLRRAAAVSKRRREIINFLLDHDYEQNEDGKILQEMTLFELEQAYVSVSYKKINTMAHA